jgi:hypothetical protein
VKLFRRAPMLRMMSMVEEGLGSYAQLEQESPAAIDHGGSMRVNFNACGDIVAGGTFEVQCNTIGGRTLRLPR